MQKNQDNIEGEEQSQKTNVTEFKHLLESDSNQASKVLAKEKANRKKT